MLLNLLLSVGLLAFARADDAAPKLGDCAPKHCGTGPNITFPFWISDIHNKYCGHPLFTITCNDSRPLIKLSGENYSVSGISYSDSTFNLSRASPLPTNNGSCLSPPERFTLVDAFFEPSDGWLYFSNCMKDLPNGNYKYCRRDGGNETYYIVTERGRINRSCNPFEKYPAPIGWGLNYSGYENFANQMFRLNWNGFNCRACTASGGECGYNVSKPGVICICGDRIHANSCVNKASGSLLNGKAKIIVWVSSMAGIFILSCFLYLCLGHVKRNSTSFLGTFLRKISKDNTMGRELHLLENHFQTHIFSYKELEEATDCFADANEIGDGGFGTVYKGKLRDGRIVAVKRLYESNYKRMDQFVNEVSIFNRIRHKNLISFYGCTNFYSRGLLLVYEYISNGTVADHLYGSRADQPLTWTMRMTIAMETAEVLAYLHATEPPIIHRDIKTSNILLDDHYHVKVADFGLSRLFPPDASYVSTVPQGTPGYLDPEYHRDYRLTDKSDVYSFGVVLAELISSKPAVDISRDMSEINLSDMTINKIQHNLLHELVDQAFGFETDREVRKMVEEVAMLAFRCMQTEKAYRPSMEEVFQVLKKASNRDKECSKAIKSGKNSSEDACLLCPVQNSPDTVHAAWVSPSTTPNTSG